MVEPIFPAREEPRARRPLLGYAMVLSAATLFAVNGTVSKVILASGLSSLRLTQVRSTGALAGLVIGLALASPRSLRVRRAELPLLAVFAYYFARFFGEEAMRSAYAERARPGRP